MIMVIDDLDKNCGISIDKDVLINKVSIDSNNEILILE